MLSEVAISQVARELLELADQADGGVLLDLDGVAFLASAMIGKLVLLNKKCKAKKTEIKICHVASSVMEVFEVTRLNKVLSIYGSAEEALAAFNGRAGLASPQATESGEKPRHTHRTDGVDQSVAG
jgi:anti-sigma B factor antagonist